MWIEFGHDILFNFEDMKDLLEHLSDTDREKVKDCKFKVFSDCLDDDSGDVYYGIKIFKDDTEIGSIDMLRHSNIPSDLDLSELIEYDDKPSYSYTMKLNEDSKEDFSSKDTGDPFNNSDGGFGIKGKWRPFDDSKFRCKKCGKIFCTCNTFFSRRG